MRSLLPIALVLVACGGSEKTYDDSLRATKADSAGVARAIDSWTFSSCGQQPDCVDRFAALAGESKIGPESPNPRAAMANPDAAWLTGWDQLPSGRDRTRFTYAALALMAHNRSYANACDAAYAKVKSGIDARLAKAEKAIADTKAQPNPYDRITALLALRPPSDPPKPTPFTEGSDAARLAIELGIFDGFEATNRTFLYLIGGFAPKESLANALSTRDPAVERDLFCLEAMAGKISGVPPYPEPGPEFAAVRGVVSEVVPDARAKIAQRRKPELAEVAKKQLEKAMAKNVGLPPGVRVMGAGKIVRFERDGRGAKVGMTTVTETRDGAGKVTKIDETISATFPDWPSNLVLDLGDTITFYGVEDKLKETVIKSTPTLEHKSREITASGKHLVRVNTKSKTINFVDAP